MGKDSLKKSKDSKSLEVVGKLNDLQKAYSSSKPKGELSVGRNFVVPDVISTGIPELDNQVLEIGGFPIGRVVEIAGETNAGKTTLALNFAREAIKQGKSVVIAENEGTFTYEYAEGIGMDPDSYFLLKGSTLNGPEYFDEIMKVCELGADVIIIDSMFGIEGLASGEVNLADAKMNTRLSTPMLHKDFASKWKNGWPPFFPEKLKRGQKVFKGIDSNTTLICINHLKPVFNGFRGQKKASGSADIPFLYTFRVWLSRLGMSMDKVDLDDNGNPIYTRVKVGCEKSKLSPGGRSTILYLDNRNGQFVTDAKVIVEMAVNRGVVIKGGAWVKLDPRIIAEGKGTEWVKCLSEDMKWQGAKAFVDFCNENIPLLDYILKFDKVGE